MCLTCPFNKTIKKIKNCKLLNPKNVAFCQTLKYMYKNISIILKQEFNWTIVLSAFQTTNIITLFTNNTLNPL